MKHAPSAFVSRLDREFGGRLRIRWSDQREEWHIEQKVGNAVVPAFHVSDFDDEAIRARDGYGFVMAIREGTRMPCPRCGSTLAVPALHTAETRCDSCKRMGYGHVYAAAYFPLEGDALIQYLRRLDPLLGHRDEITRDQDEARRRIEASRERHCMNEITAATAENYRRIAGIPQFGYTG